MPNASENTIEKFTTNDIPNVIAIGASAGGLEALQAFLSHLPPINSTCIIIAQHLSPTHKSMLVQLLSRETKLLVTEANHGEVLEANKVYITPPDNEIRITNGKIHLQKPASPTGPKPSVDVLFCSLANQKASLTIGIILSGTGSDGKEGVKELVTSGALVLVQDPETAKYDGMPQSAINTGLNVTILAPEKMGEEIADYLKNPLNPIVLKDTVVQDQTALNRILYLMGKRTNSDFSNYKTATICRRLEKRMAMLKISSIDQYLTIIEDNPDELEIMFNMILIGVTTFFRDLEAFGVLEDYLHKIINKKTGSEPIRIWVTGCSTGEEPYSIAILLHRLLKTRTRKHNIQIFATDIDERAIAFARKGIYTKAAINDLPQSVKDTYFVLKNDGYELLKAIRSMVLFSKHDVINNPPFLKLDLISCRNLLIYFNADLQKQILPIFHYAINPDGYLFLGKSESIGGFTDLFVAADTKYKIFQRKRGGNIHQIKFSAFKIQKQGIPRKDITDTTAKVSLSDMVKDTLFNSFEHPYVIVNELYDIREVAGDVRLFLSLSAGAMQVNLLKMINPELHIEVRSILTKAIKERTSIKSNIKKFNFYGTDHFVKIIVKPLIYSNTIEDLFIIVFEKLELEPFLTRGTNEKVETQVNDRILELEFELNTSKEHLQTYIEEIETSNEELQSLNEELQSTNEELQSTNEELETSNEELQSTNEEIQVAYSELRKINEELELKDKLLSKTQANKMALLNNGLQGILLLDNKLQIQDFNLQAIDIFKQLKGKDIEKHNSIYELLPKGSIEIIIDDITKALQGESFAIQRALRDHQNQTIWLTCTYTPVMVKPGQIEGISIGLLDITREKRSETEMSWLINNTEEAFILMDKELKILSFNQQFKNLYSSYFNIEIQKGESILKYAQPHRIDILKQIYENVFAGKEEENTLTFELSGDGEHKINLKYKPANNERGEIVGAFVTAKDVTEKELLRKIEMLELVLMEESIKRTAHVEELINKYLTGLEEIMPTLKTSILKVKEGHVYHYLAPSMPKSLIEAFEGRKIGPGEGSCGTAAFTHKTVIVNDIAQHTYWQKYKDFALQEGLQSCWSQPIFNSNGEVIATFAHYYTQKKEPTAKELEEFKHSASLLGVVLESDYKTTELKISNERYQYVTKATSDAIWDFDIDNKKLYWGEGFNYLFGFNTNDEQKNYQQWSESLHEDEKEAILEKVNKYLEGDTRSWKHEYRFKKADGNYVYVSDKAYVLRNVDGKPIRIIGAIQDISVQKNQEIQKKLLADISLFFNQEKTLSASLYKVIEHIGKFGNFQIAEIWLPSLNHQHLQLTAKYHADQKDALIIASNVNPAVSFEKSLPGLVWKTKKNKLWSENQANEHFFTESYKQQYDLKTILGLPLHDNNDMVGVLILGSCEPELSQLSFQHLLMQLETFIGSEIKRKKIENELNQIFDFAPDLIGIMGNDGTLVKINPAGARLLEYNQDELIGLPLKKLIHPDDEYIVLREIGNAGETLKGANFECRYLSKSGTIKWLSWTATPSPHDNLIFSVAKDVTEQKKLQNLLNSANKLAKIGSWEVNLLTNKVFWSDITREIRETPPDFEPNLQAGINHFLPGENQDTIAERVKECIEKGTPWDEELQIITFKGNLKWVRTIGKAEFVNNKCYRIYGSFQDINERKIAELEITKKSFLLEAIANVITIFLQSEDWFDALSICFKITGDSIGLDRIFLIEQCFSPQIKQDIFNQTYLWEKERGGLQKNDTIFTNTSVNLLSELYIPLSNGETVHYSSSELPNGLLKQHLTATNTQSLLAIPIIISNKMFGFVGFEDCKTDRVWSEDEIFFLQSITSNLSSAIQRRKSKLAIEKAFEEKNNILEAIGDGFLTINNLGIITYWNKSAEKTLKYNREEVLNKNISYIFNADDDAIFIEQFDLAFATNEPLHFEAYYTKFNIWLDVSVYPVKDGLSLYFKDISEKKKNEERIRQSNERFEKVSEATNDAIWDWDIVHDTLYWGDGYNKLFGYDTNLQFVPATLWKESLHPDDMETAVNTIEQLLNQTQYNNWTQEYRFKKTNGSYAFVVDRGIVIRDKEDKPIRMIGAMSDITYRKEAEENLKKLNQRLEVYTKELKISNDELEQFAYVASHDLQEPLRMITSYLTLIEKRYNDVFDDKAKQYIYFAIDGAKRMRQIIMDLLEFSRVGKHADSVELIAIDKVVSEIEILYRKLIEETNATISYKNLPVIKSFRSPLVQLFQNLVGNALKYRRPNVAPRITIEAQEIDTYWQFSVADNGIGVEKAYFDRIFILFQRLHNRDEFSGTGMGLAIVKKILDNLGGKVWLESEPGKGSTFLFTIPKD